jgi:ankyrin repeat protein
VLVLVKECGANSKAVNDSGNNAVWAAAMFGHTETVRTLVSECGVDPEVANNNGITPLWEVAGKGYTDTVRALVSECGGLLHTKILICI